MTLHVALVTCRELAGLDADDRLVADELVRRGARVSAAMWEDAGVDWLAFDAIVVRSAWGYVDDPARYRAWLETLAQVEQRGCAVFNAPALMLHNLDKRYLLELLSRGVPIVPTALYTPGDSLAELLDERGWSQAVVKPVVSAGSYATHRVTAPISASDERAARRAAQREGAALLQPYLHEIERDGELSVIFVDGRASHAVRKRPAGGDFRVQEQFGGSVEAVALSEALRLAGERVLAAACDEPPLYARVDGVLRDDELLLMELELVEPSLFFGSAPHSAGRFAEVLLRRSAVKQQGRLQLVERGDLQR